MSGICAVWEKKTHLQVGTTIVAVNARLRATGSESGVTESDPESGVAVAAQRSSDRQRVFRNNRVLLVCDTDLLNEAELSADLGRIPQGTGTAALLAALYEHLGERFVNRLRGAFSFVLWDQVERRWIAAIDGFGLNRLVWYEDDDVLLIASRADAVRARIKGLAINPRAIANVLNFSANLAPETIFDRIHRLSAGTVLNANGRRTQADTYWDLTYDPNERTAEAALSRDLERVVETSVAAHLAGLPASATGAFLSGGTDSSTIVGLMTRSTGGRIKTFSIGFEEHGYSELDYAQLAARAFDTDHHTYLVNARDCADSLDSIISSFDEPFGNSSAIATYFCGRLAAENGVRMLFAGDGGDELFGGNERYATEKIFERYHLVPKLLRVGVIEPLAALPFDISVLRKARGYIRRANMKGVERVLSFQFLRTHPLDEVFTADFLEALDGYSVLEIPSRHYAKASACDHLDRLLYVDMKVTLADNDLPKVTTMCTLAGVSTRFPFLDREVAEFAGRIPPGLKVKGSEKRYLFKRAFRNLLPARIIQKKKHGFGVPVASWIKRDSRMRALTYDTLLSPRALARGYFRQEFIERLLQHNEIASDAYYGDTLWTFLMLELWQRRFVDEPAQVVG